MTYDLCTNLPGLEGHRGAGFIADLNISETYEDSTRLLQYMDELRLHMTARCMYEHTAIRDAEGHLSVGFLWAALTLLTQLSVGIRGGLEIEFGAIFQRFVQTDLQLYHITGANTSTYAERVERMLRGTDRSVTTLMRAFGSTTFVELCSMPRGGRACACGAYRRLICSA